MSDATTMLWTIFSVVAPMLLLPAIRFHLNQWRLQRLLQKYPSAILVGKKTERASYRNLFITACQDFFVFFWSCLLYFVWLIGTGVLASFRFVLAVFVQPKVTAEETIVNTPPPAVKRTKNVPTSVLKQPGQNRSVPRQQVVFNEQNNGSVRASYYYFNPDDQAQPTSPKLPIVQNLPSHSVQQRTTANKRRTTPHVKQRSSPEDKENTTSSKKPKYVFGKTSSLSTLSGAQKLSMGLQKASNYQAARQSVLRKHRLSLDGGLADCSNSKPLKYQRLSLRGTSSRATTTNVNPRKRTQVEFDERIWKEINERKTRNKQSEAGVTANSAHAATTTAQSSSNNANSSGPPGQVSLSHSTFQPTSTGPPVSQQVASTTQQATFAATASGPAAQSTTQHKSTTTAPNGIAPPSAANTPIPSFTIGSSATETPAPATMAAGPSSTPLVANQGTAAPISHAATSQNSTASKKTINPFAALQTNTTTPSQSSQVPGVFSAPKPNTSAPAAQSQQAQVDGIAGGGSQNQISGVSATTTNNPFSAKNSSDTNNDSGSFVAQQANGAQSTTTTSNPLSSAANGPTANSNPFASQQASGSQSMPSGVPAASNNPFSGANQGPTAPNNSISFATQQASSTKPSTGSQSQLSLDPSTSTNPFAAADQSARNPSSTVNPFSQGQPQAQTNDPKPGLRFQQQQNGSNPTFTNPPVTQHSINGPKPAFGSQNQFSFAPPSSNNQIPAPNLNAAAPSSSNPFGQQSQSTNGSKLGVASQQNFSGVPSSMSFPSSQPNTAAPTNGNPFGNGAGPIQNANGAASTTSNPFANKIPQNTSAPSFQQPTAQRGTATMARPRRKLKAVRPKR